MSKFTPKKIMIKISKLRLPVKLAIIKKQVTHKKLVRLNLYSNFTFTKYLLHRYFSLRNVLFELYAPKVEYLRFLSFYSSVMVKKSSFGLTFLETLNFTNRNQLILINNKNKQIFITIIRNAEFLISMSTGTCLKFLNLQKKELKRKVSSFILQIKLLINVINDCYTYDWLFVNIIGTKKNFFRWLNFLKYTLLKAKVLIYVYTPALFQAPIKVKKIKSIKRRLKKKYLYKEVF